MGLTRFIGVKSEIPQIGMGDDVRALLFPIILGSLTSILAKHSAVGELSRYSDNE